jgi:hypothetical protein
MTAAMVVSDLRILGQVGTTIGLGLLFDTLVVRSFMTRRPGPQPVKHWEASEPGGKLSV